VITEDRLAAALNRLIPFSSFHRNVNPEKLDGLRRQALQGLIDEELQFEEARRLKLAATRAEVDRETKRIGASYKTDEAFALALRQSGITLEGLRLEVARQILIRKVAESAVTTKCAVSPAQVEDFYQKNTARFRMPEQLHVFAITIGVDKAGSRQDWENGRKQAEEVARLLGEGAAFEELARKYSSDPSKDKGGDMGLIHRGRMTDEFEAVLKDMKPRQTSGVIRSIYGYHIVRLTEVLPPVQRTFVEVKVQLQKDLTAKNCAAMKDQWIAGLRSAATIVIAPAADGKQPPGR
jgi:parvulin-like peptidyl-prolyl isomerase